MFGLNEQKEILDLKSRCNLFAKGRFKFHHCKHPLGTHYESDQTVTTISEKYGKPLLEVTATEILHFPILIVGYVNADERQWPIIIEFLEQAPSIGFNRSSIKDFESFRKFIEGNNIILSEARIKINTQNNGDKKTEYERIIFFRGDFVYSTMYGFCEG